MALAHVVAAQGTRAEVTLARVDGNLEDGLATELAAPGSHPVGRRVKRILATVDNILEAGKCGALVVHVLVDLAEQHLVRVVVEVAARHRLRQQRCRLVQVGEDLGVGFLHRVAEQLGRSVDLLGDHRDAIAVLIHVVRLTIDAHQVEVDQRADGQGLAQDVVEILGRGLILHLLDVVDDVVGLQQAVVARGPEAPIRAAGRRVVEIVERITRVTAGIDGHVTALRIAVEHEVAAVVAGGTHLVDQSVQHDLCIVHAGQAGRRVSLVGRSHVEETLAGSERQDTGQ